MPTNYVLKKPAMDPNRIQKISKKLLDECSEDRNLALEAYRYFKDMVDENPRDTSAKSQMVDCLKLAQSSKNNIIKLVDLLIKLETTKSQAGEGSESSIFSQLDGISA